MSLMQRACVVLVRPQGPINLGLICRACVNMGVGDLRVVSPDFDLGVRETRMFAMHALDLLDSVQVFTGLREATADCGFIVGSSAHRRFRGRLPFMSPKELPDHILERAPTRFALVFGNEAEGLSNDELLNCHAYVSIEAPGSHKSYNLSHAVAIALYCLANPQVSLVPTNFKASEERILLDLYSYWLETLDRFGFFRRANKQRFAPKFKRLLHRLHLSEHDAHTLRGMLVHINRHAPRAEHDT
ncbi:MAG: RNA methyltransferase [Myxococcota bacterium]